MMVATRRATAIGAPTEQQVLAASFARSSLGVVLVATSAKGVAAAFIGDDRESLRRELEREFPNANVVDERSSDGSPAARLARRIDSPASGENGTRFELDLRGTEFQRAVWHALLEIPVGATATYAEIAERVGEPNAARGVAQACAANSIAILIPCHRVVRSDGALSGYRWGVERKRALLERERAR